MTKQETFGHRLITYATCLALGLIPLSFSYGVYEYALWPKRLVFYIGMGLASLGWAIKTNWGKDLRLVSPNPFVPVGLFAIWSILQLFQSTHLLDSLVEVCYVLELLAFFFILANNFSDRDLPPVLWTTTLTGGLIGLMGILQYHNLAFVNIPTNGHPSATFGYRNFAAVYLVAILPLVAFHFLTSQKRLSQMVSWISGLLMFLYLIYTRTRASWVGLGVGSLLVVLFLITQKTHRASLFATLQNSVHRFHKILCLCGLVFLGLLAPLSPTFTDTGLQRFDDKKDSITTTVTSIFSGTGDRGRLHMWANTLSLIADHPLLGVGPGGWKRIYPAYDNGVMIRKDSAPVRPHNDYLWIASDYGLLGLGIVAWFFILIFHACYKQGRQTHATRPLAVALFAISMLSVFGDACFSFPKDQPPPMAYMFCICGFIVAWQQTTTRTIRPILSRLLLIGLFALSSMATLLVWHQIRFDMHYLNALIAEKDDDWNTVMDEVEKGLSYGSFRSHMWIIKGRAKERQGHYDQAEAAYLQALSYAPYSWHAHNGLGIIYKRQEKFDQALEQYNKALAYFPGENNYSAIQIRTNLGALYTSMGKTQLAEQEYRAILKIEPRDPGTNNNMGNLFKAQGQLDSAEVAYLVALRSDSTLIQAHFNLSDLYIKKGRLTDALIHAQKAAKLQPDNARIHWNLGRIQEANRQLKEALKAYQQAIDTDPSFAQPYFNIGNLLFDFKQYAEAQHAYHNFVDKWTGDASYVQFANNRILLCQDYYRRQQTWRTKKAETP